ncbi:MAG: secretin N-terminal domain-containing protein, partial [Candidatus Omnitrophota bacterium]|nr:secretin N-terminal domain-containing protein [Candidatus Omnitrophota bacterium]
DVVKILSIQSGLNFIASEAVQDRKITLFLDKVPVQEVMDKLFKANNLTYELDEEAKIFIVKDWGKPEVETITKVFYLKYRSVPSANIEKEKSSLIGTTTGASTAGDIVTSIRAVLSANGKITEDSRTNSLIVTDIPSRLPLIQKIISQLDIPQSQVMLEVEILDVSKNVVDKMGFDFGDNPISILIGRAGGSGNRIRAFLGDVTKKAPQAFTSSATGVVAIGGAYAEVLDFLRTQTDTKYLARPRLLTLNNETAEIAMTKDEVVGKKETSVTPTTGGATTTVEYTRSTDLKLNPEGTGIYLRVTPQINLDTNEITMVINPKSSVTSTSALSTTANPQSDVEVRSTKSIVKVRDGETVVLGGLIHTDRNVIVKKVPILGDIPILGALFRHKSKTKDIERELIVFITPHIVKDKNIEVVQAKKLSLLAREQTTASATERQLSMEASLNSFEKVKEKFH